VNRLNIPAVIDINIAICIHVSDIPQMFAKIQQFFTLSFFLKIAFPIQAYFLEISHTFWSCTFNESF